MADMARRALGLLELLAVSSLVIAACNDARQHSPTVSNPVADSGGAMPAASAVPEAPPDAALPPDSAPAAGGAPARVGESIGSATMEADGTIVLQLRAETGSAVGDALFRYPPSHEEYVRIRAHVGPIEPGQSRPVPPFPDKAPARADPAGVAEALPPIEIDCAVDADCALSDIDIVGDACCPGRLTQVVNKRWKQRAEAFCAAHPAGSCPKKRCGEASPPTCRDGKCTNDA